jgi:hypothetical protein
MRCDTIQCNAIMILHQTYHAGNEDSILMPRTNAKTCVRSRFHHEQRTVFADSKQSLLRHAPQFQTRTQPDLYSSLSVSGRSNCSIRIPPTMWIINWCMFDSRRPVQNFRMTGLPLSLSDDLHWCFPLQSTTYSPPSVSSTSMPNFCSWVWTMRERLRCCTCCWWVIVVDSGDCRDSLAAF